MNIQEWRNQHEHSHYPFKEDTGKAGDIEIPPEFLVDACLHVPTSAPTRIASLRAVGARIFGVIQQGDTVIGSFTFTYDALVNGQAEIFDQYGVSRGRLISGKNGRQIFRVLGNSTLITVEGELEFEASTLLVIPSRTVRSITVNGVRYHGKIHLVEGRGVRITHPSTRSIRISASGQPSDLIEECCGDLAVPIERINEVPPNEYGDLALQPAPFSEPSGPDDQRQVIRVTDQGNGLLISVANPSI